jgi:acyl-CoA synthetase (AMP-forming)/AMP-acid ligase II
MLTVLTQRPPFRSGSSTILPKEIEDVIALHPAVREVSVQGLASDEWGEAVTANYCLQIFQTHFDQAHLSGFLPDTD